jgi:hypothetical protein
MRAQPNTEDGRRVQVVKSDPPESKEILTEAIVRVGDAVHKLNASGLNRKAIVLLLNDATKVNRADIIKILDALPKLRGWYCK